MPDDWYWEPDHDFGSLHQCAYSDHNDTPCPNVVALWRHSANEDGGRVWLCRWHAGEEQQGKRGGTTDHQYYLPSGAPYETTNDKAVLLYLAARGRELSHA